MSFRKDKSRGAISRPGFALIELLVVIAIVALLLAILVPSLKHVRMRSRVVCVHSDLRQITTALDSYAMNNHSRLPPTRFACGTHVNYQLPVELAATRYLPRSASLIPQAQWQDPFDPDHTYKYRAPGPIYQNGTLFDFPQPDKAWKPRGKIWVPDDFPTCKSEEGRYYCNRADEPRSPVAYAVWSVGPDPESPKFPRDEASGTIDESRFPVPRSFWLTHSGDTGLITHMKSRKSPIYMSP